MLALPKKKKNLKNEFSPPQGATRVELATAGSAILCSTAELHTRRWGRVPVSKKKIIFGLARAATEKKKIKKRSKLTGVGFEPTPPKRRELESPALDHSAIQPWPRRPRTAGQRTNERPTTAGRGRCVSVRYAVRPREKKKIPRRRGRRGQGLRDPTANHPKKKKKKRKKKARKELSLSLSFFI